jgi:hypothetical protein
MPTELIKVGCCSIRSEINKLTNSIRNKEELPGDRKESFVLLIYRKGDGKIAIITEAYPFVKFVSNFIQHPLVKVTLMKKNLLSITMLI